jgi:D-ornithine 4,5-aminomutase subunit beta
LPTKTRELKERAVLFLEDILNRGGYFAAVEQGQFVDSGNFPERVGDGIARDPKGGVAADTIIKREANYGAPVCHHFGQNRYADTPDKACAAYGGCTLCEASNIQYIDELDDVDNVHQRLQKPLADQAAGWIRPEVEWSGDSMVCVTLFVPEEPQIAEAAAGGSCIPPKGACLRSKAASIMRSKETS